MCSVREISSWSHDITTIVITAIIVTSKDSQEAKVHHLKMFAYIKKHRYLVGPEEDVFML